MPPLQFDFFKPVRKPFEANDENIFNKGRSREDFNSPEPTKKVLALPRSAFFELSSPGPPGGLVAGGLIGKPFT